MEVAEPGPGKGNRGSRTTGLEFRERWRWESWGFWEGEGWGGLGLECWLEELLPTNEGGWKTSVREERGSFQRGCITIEKG